MVSRPALAVLAAAITLVPGCLSSEEEPVAQGTIAVTDETALGVTGASGLPPTADAAPLWSVGDFWEYQTPGGGATLVVTSASASLYELLPTDEALATYDAAFDVSYVGPIGARDLSGRQGEDAVRFLQFPLTDNLSWTTLWDGDEVTITATADPAVKTPVGPSPGFTLVARNSTGAETVRYTYAPVVGWFTSLEFYENGVPTYSVELQRFGKGFQGVVHRGEARSIIATSSTLGPSSSSGSFPVREEERSLVASYTIGGAAQAMSALLIDPSNGKHDIGPKPVNLVTQGREGGIVTIPAAPGTWQYSATFAGAPTLSFHKFSLSVVTLTPVTLA